MADEWKEPDSDDDYFLPEDEVNPVEDNISPAVRALMQKYVLYSWCPSDSSSLILLRVDKRPGLLDFQRDEVEPTCSKVYYASRTHSQLTQILPELRRLKLPPPTVHLQPMSVSSSLDSRKRGVDEMDGQDESPLYSRTVALGSRKQLCINDDLRARSRDLDEGCRELLRGEIRLIVCL